MDKRTILAVVLSVTVMVIWYMLFPTPNKDFISEERELSQDSIEKVLSLPEKKPIPFVIEALPSNLEQEDEIEAEKIYIETDLVVATFSSKGGDLVSYTLKKHFDAGEAVELLYPWDEDGGRVFGLSFGGNDNALLDDIFIIKEQSETSIEFVREYTVEDQNGEKQEFSLSKRWSLYPGEYLFQLEVSIDGGNTIPRISNSDFAYTVHFGPQLGPILKQTKAKGRYQDFREFWSHREGKIKREKIKNTIQSSDHRLTWTGIVGKYFMLSIIPDATPYRYTWDTSPVLALDRGTQLSLLRPALKGSINTDTYKIYLGPKVSKDLAIYNNPEKNIHKLSGMNLDGVLRAVPVLGHVETLMKLIMMFFYKLIPNYGVSILLLTVLVKALMFPLTRKSSESTLRMQTLSPRIKEIQDRYKDNPTKMNMEMAELYKKEGYNPLSGCFPMLIQIPIFFAMYNLFNNHFDLRGAMFIPGWIPDLSQPEFVWSFAPFRIPLLGWSELRVLPFLYLASQLLFGRVNQAATQQNNTQTMMFMYVMPIMFFFILYDVPSGLLLYWIMSNTLSLVQQKAINKIMAEKKAVLVETVEKKTAILPPKLRKKK